MADKSIVKNNILYRTWKDNPEFNDSFEEEKKILKNLYIYKMDIVEPIGDIIKDLVAIVILQH